MCVVLLELAPLGRIVEQKYPVLFRNWVLEQEKLLYRYEYPDAFFYA